MLPFRPKRKGKKHPCGFLHALTRNIREKIYANYFDLPVRWAFYADLWTFVKLAQHPQAAHLRATYMVTDRKFCGAILATCCRIQREASATLQSHLTLILTRYVTMEPMVHLCSPDGGLLDRLQKLNIDIALDDLPSRAADVVRIHRLPQLTNVTIRCSAAIWAFRIPSPNDFPVVWFSAGRRPERLNTTTFFQAYWVIYSAVSLIQGRRGSLNVAEDQSRRGNVVQWKIRMVDSPVQWVGNLSAGTFAQIKPTAFRRDTHTGQSVIATGSQFNDDQAKTSQPGDENSRMDEATVEGIKGDDAPMAPPPIWNAARLPMALREVADEDKMGQDTGIGDTTMVQSPV